MLVSLIELITMRIAHFFPTIGTTVEGGRCLRDKDSI